MLRRKAAPLASVFSEFLVWVPAQVSRATATRRWWIALFGAGSATQHKSAAPILSLRPIPALDAGSANGNRLKLFVRASHGFSQENAPRENLGALLSAPPRPARQLVAPQN